MIPPSQNTHPEPESVPCLELHFQDNRGDVISEEGQGLALVQRYPAAETRAAAHHHRPLPVSALAWQGGTAQVFYLSSLGMTH